MRALSILCPVVLLLGCNGERGPHRARMASKGKVAPLGSRFNAEQGFAFVVPQLAPVAGVGGLRASQCGVCHQAIYAEWQASTHAAALSDLQYQAELFKKSSPRWLCLNCHIPVQNQRRYRVTGLRGGDVLRPAQVRNPGFDAALQAEAITCATCHVRPDKQGRSVVVGTRGNPQAPHPVRADREGLRNICLRCHDPKGERITPLLVCWFQTRKEASEGPAGPSAPKRDCVDCHMPATGRRLAKQFAAYPSRKNHQHHWVGGGVPKRFGGYDKLLARGYHSGLRVTLGRAERVGGKVAFEAVLEAHQTGHWLPTADPERHLLLLATLRGADGRRLGRKRGRIGQVWKWSPRAEKVSDNRLRPGKKRRWTGSFAPQPAAATLELKIWHVRLTSENAKHMRKAQVREDYVPGLGKLLHRLERHYPMATLVYREVVDLTTGTRTRATTPQLLKASAAEQRKGLSDRDY